MRELAKFFRVGAEVSPSASYLLIYTRNFFVSAGNERVIRRLVPFLMKERASEPSCELLSKCTPPDCNGGHSGTRGQLRQIWLMGSRAEMLNELRAP
jgi:hypothetical protein